MLKLSNIKKEFFNKDEKFVLKDINLDIEKGEFFSILGPSGCGKTTLLKIITGIIDDYQGDVILNGKNINGVKTEKRRISMVFQEPLLFPNMTVGENVGFGLKMQKVAKKERDLRVREMLKKVELEGYENRRTHELSGGQKQRVAIARAMVVEPELIIMDEPFSALDQELRSNMQEFIRKLHKCDKMTVIFVTHDQEEASYLSDRIAILKNGELQQIGTSKELYINPSNRYVAKFLGARNILDGKFVNGKFIKKEFVLETNIENNGKGAGD